MANSRLCSIPDCGKPVKARGYCSMHHHRLLRHGDPMGGSTFRGEPAKWVEAAIGYDGDECLLWPFSKSNGHGTATTMHGERAVHRIVCVAVHGPAPNGYEAAHSCGNGHLGCATPKHLRWATRAENIADRVLHGTSNRGQRHGMTKLTEEKVMAIRRMAKTRSQSQVAREFGISQPAVSAIVNRVRWGWLDEKPSQVSR